NFSGVDFRTAEVRDFGSATVRDCRTSVVRGCGSAVALRLFFSASSGNLLGSGAPGGFSWKKTDWPRSSLAMASVLSCFLLMEKVLGSASGRRERLSLWD